MRPQTFAFSKGRNAPTSYHETRPRALQTLSAARHHFSTATPDDYRVIDAFLSRLPGRTAALSSSTDLLANQGSRRTPDNGNPVHTDPQTRPKTSIEHFEQDQLKSISYEPFNAHSPDLLTAVENCTSSTKPACLAQNLSSPSYIMKAHESEQGMRIKGLAASKWGAQDFNTERFMPGDGLARSPLSKPPTLPSLSAFTPLEDVSNGTRTTATPQRRDDSFRTPDSTKSLNVFPPSPATAVNNSRIHRKERFKLIYPPPDSIFTDLTLQEVQKARAETLERRVQQTRDARSQVRDKYETFESVKAKQDTPDLMLQPSMHEHATKYVRGAPQQCSSSQLRGTYATGQDKSTSSTRERKVYSQNEMLGLSRTVDTAAGEVIPYADKALDATVVALFKKLNTTHTENDGLDLQKLKRDDFKLVDDSGTFTATAESSSSLATYPLTLLAQSAEPELLLSMGDACDPDDNSKSSQPNKPNLDSTATVGAWQDFSRSQQAKSDITEQGGGNSTTKEQLFFKSYPKPEKRLRPAAESRKIILKNLPITSTPKMITSMILGGPLELVQYNKGSSMAYITFLHGTDARAFFDENANGLSCPGDKLRAVWVELDEERLPHSPMIQLSIEKGWTRSVKVVGIEKDTSSETIATLAQGKSKERNVASIALKKLPSGAYAAEIHFCSIKDAHDFTNFMRLNEDYEHCNVQYIQDPCEGAITARRE